MNSNKKFIKWHTTRRCNDKINGGDWQQTMEYGRSKLFGLSIVQYIDDKAESEKGNINLEFLVKSINKYIKVLDLDYIGIGEDDSNTILSDKKYEYEKFQADSISRKELNYYNFDLYDDISSINKKTKSYTVQTTTVVLDEDFFIVPVSQMTLQDFLLTFKEWCKYAMISNKYTGGVTCTQIEHVEYFPYFAEQNVTSHEYN